MRLRDYEPGDEPTVLALNAESVAVLSPMDAGRFARLREAAALLRVAEHEGTVAGFLMGFCAGSDYDSPNYRWFSDNFSDFFYVDRVVVDSTRRGLGLASAFYDECIAWATAQQLTAIVAEIDIEPPNVGSLRFHEKYGFEEVDRLTHSASKVVSLQRLSL
ncbi:MAG: GNAT family N-acetyltransferase [Halieaceae bacterium]|jgi:predicted GNAT superfamily acetyltransferase|nr:GNAT family N-acetyltransferase [Halieaceae bacterium]